MLISAVVAAVRFEPRPLLPEQITSNSESRTLDNPELKEFLETNLNLIFFNSAHIFPGFYRADSGRSVYHPELDVG